ncbi:TPA: anti-adapter protein IraM [Escherichia coli]|nr:anti-adapter protein IraM [Escherichia coli]HBN1784797.1 anti-adapter protein IraM [Escherichia coli]HBN2068063.1 anti-adapter protein IraM [Escherichia coli]HBN2072484.1 anti-adapter protein IraM [Escherichia coli]HBN2112474.1 anti-adapter protein IraM [Escherichia coli]
MNWVVIDTVIQPSSGISFSAIWCEIRLIIWYQSDVYLPPDSTFNLVHAGIMLNNKNFPITIYNVTPFNKILWRLIKNNKGCPPESEQTGSRCPNDHCILAICPYGRK